MNTVNLIIFEIILSDPSGNTTKSKYYQTQRNITKLKNQIRGRGSGVGDQGAVNDSLDFGI
jgi:hypothetical protein